MAFELLDTTSYLVDEAKDYLQKHNCRIRRCALAGMTVDESRREMQGVQAVIAGGDEHWTDELLGAAAGLKIVARTGAGVETVDLAAAARRGIWVTNTPGATSNAVADFTLGLIICLLRNIPSAAEDMKKGKWNRFRGRELGSLTLGIVGAGSIGKEVIKRARGFGARILAYDITPDSEFAEEWGVQYVSLDELMSRSDIVSLHCSLNEKTRGLIDGRRLKLMKKEACLVNTSRAQVVEKEALVAVLRVHGIAGAAIDVHDPAPCPPDEPLVALDNVIVTPWTAYNTQESVSAMCMSAVIDAVSVLEGRTPRFPVNKPEVRQSG